MRLEQIQEKIKSLKIDNRNKISNFYNQSELKDKEFQTWMGEDTIIFWFKKINVNQVYFYSGDEEELREGLNKLPISYTIHVITDKKECASDWEQKLGCPLYDIYGRFGHSLGDLEMEKKRFADMKLDRFYDKSLGMLADKSDLKELQQMIYQTFDESCDQLFIDEEMERLIDNKNVWIAKDENKICTIFIYRIEGKKYYANLALNHSTADVLYSIQKKSILEAIEEYHVTYFYGWQSLKNIQASRKHGFPEYNLYDLIFKKE